MNFKVVEKFISVNGEGLKAGELAVFIRFAGCNLNCSYCDTMWANEHDVEYELMNEYEIYEYIKETGIRNVTLTGGEPLLQKGLEILLEILFDDKDIEVEIETNGSIDLESCDKIRNDFLSITMDYKLHSSNMENKMHIENFDYLTSRDTVKFVVGSIDDLSRASKLIDEFQITDRCNVYLSPVYDEIDTKDIVEFMKSYKMNKVKLQIQMHKIIWDQNERGV